ncbi:MULTISPECIES: hypothetical protein [unclassified Chryseobacterium]|uniref:hypothetical protein n=1 Tax=unclassified Chryseobacterium TaxID=2593645 RepID=UPI00100BEDAD|nr:MULTISPECIES: hypothetical protein [unclassified Chryseobacterium]RXM50617.1 hypothetical protein BOQ64_17905 [Chryseobacterium sp. CH25]RXM63250.1 hypothetical protein BOQ60_18100 [Chryseobacterium sp. CH1]
MKITALLLVFGSFSVYSQTGSVGINTSNPDPSAILHLNSSDKGLLIPRIALQNETDITTIASPAKGLVIYNTNTSLVNGEGFYINYGTSAAAQWTTFVPSNTNNYQLDNVYSSIAANSITQTVSGAPSTSTINNINLGLGVTVTIPALTTTQVIVTYSTPIGFNNPSVNSFGGYMGIRFLKNGVEAASGSRKYTIPQIISSLTPGGYFTMVSVGATYTETVVNSSSTPQTITYSLNGYIEKVTGTQSVSFIFNMYDSNPANNNFNWGKGAISAQVFKKSL